VPQDIELHKTVGNARQTGPKALVALGGNVASHVGGPDQTLRAALARLVDLGLHVEAASRFYATPCFPVGSGPDYINSAAILSGGNDPHEVLTILHQVEAAFGRARDTRWGQRTLDLDLIAMGDIVLPDRDTFVTWRNLPLDQQMTLTPDHLILPHPRLQDRAFVLIPLAEIAPGWKHPISGLTVAEMAAALPEDEKTAVKPL